MALSGSSDGEGSRVVGSGSVALDVKGMLTVNQFLSLGTG